MIASMPGCTERIDLKDDAVKPTDLEKGLALFNRNQLGDALPLFELAAEHDDQNADAFAWLGETLRRLGRKDEAVAAARRALSLEPCHSFAHVVLADAFKPQYDKWPGADAESAWNHAKKAVECDPSDGNAWLGVWSGSIERGDRNLEECALEAIVDTGFLTPTILAYNRWVLVNLPENSILLTNGDMDTYPAVALQEVDDLRNDVAVVNLPMLNIGWYARFISQRYGIPLFCSDAELQELAPIKQKDGSILMTSTQIVRGWLKMQQDGSLERPIAVAVTVSDRGFEPGIKERLLYCGPFYLCRPGSTGDTVDNDRLRESILGIDPGKFTGPSVSEMDRSPVRRNSTPDIRRNLIAATLYYVKSLSEEGRFEETLDCLDLAVELDRVTGSDPKIRQAIEDLRKTVGASPVDSQD